MGGAHRVAHSCRGRGLLMVATLIALKVVPSLCFVTRPSTRSHAVIMKASVSTREAKQPHPLNNPGSNFFVDLTCIDCDTCRWMAPATFTRKGEQSVAGEPPTSDAELRSAIQAMISCPTGSIRTHKIETMVKDVMNDFPLPIDRAGLPNVYHIGWHSALSYGAAPYLIVRPEGNVMVDVPKYNGMLADKIETLGGAKYHFLSHRDDVGGLEKWKERFPEMTRVLHETEVDERTKDVEVKLRWMALEPVILCATRDKILFVPGHTEGCCALLYSVEGQLPALFSGDHMAWSGGLERLTGHPAYNWYDRRLQAESIRKLKGVAFIWLLPGHGRRYLFDQGDDKRREMLEVAAQGLERYTGHAYEDEHD